MPAFASVDEIQQAECGQVPDGERRTSASATKALVLSRREQPQCFYDLRYPSGGCYTSAGGSAKEGPDEIPKSSYPQFPKIFPGQKSGAGGFRALVQTKAMPVRPKSSSNRRRGAYTVVGMASSAGDQQRKVSPRPNWLRCVSGSPP